MQSTSQPETHSSGSHVMAMIGGITLIVVGAVGIYLICTLPKEAEISFSAKIVIFIFYLGALICGFACTLFNTRRMIDEDKDKEDQE